MPVPLGAHIQIQSPEASVFYGLGRASLNWAQLSELTYFEEEEPLPGQLETSRTPAPQHPGGQWRRVLPPCPTSRPIPCHG